MIAAGIHHDAHEPGAEPGRALEAAELLHQRAADLLRDVLGVRAQPGQPPRQSVDAIVMPPQQGLERVAVAARGAVDEIAVGIDDDSGFISIDGERRGGPLHAARDRAEVGQRTAASIQGMNPGDRAWRPERLG